MISYTVTVPLGDVTAGKKYLGIKGDKVYGYRIESTAPSEYFGD